MGRTAAEAKLWAKIGDLERRLAALSAAGGLYRQTSNQNITSGSATPLNQMTSIPVTPGGTYEIAGVIRWQNNVAAVAPNLGFDGAGGCRFYYWGASENTGAQQIGPTDDCYNLTQVWHGWNCPVGAPAYIFFTGHIEFDAGTGTFGLKGWTNGAGNNWQTFAGTYMRLTQMA